MQDARESHATCAICCGTIFLSWQTRACGTGQKRIPDEPEEQSEEITKGSEPTHSADKQSSDKKTEASLKALDMLKKGLLTEKAALAVIGTYEENYTGTPDVRIKALELVEAKKLSERGLVAILGV
jgi:hypothetical protein